MKDINFSNEEYITIFKKFQNDRTAFLFLDPPYLFTDNKCYTKQLNSDHDTSKILVDILEYLGDPETLCKVMLIINGMALVEYILKDFIVGEYVRIYQISKKKSRHFIVCNYDL